MSGTSALLGSACLSALLVFCFWQFAWYWPIVLFVLGSVVGGALFGVLDFVTGAVPMNLASFVGWSVSAIWLYSSINNIPT